MRKAGADHAEVPHLARSAPRWLTSLVDSVTVLLVAFGFAVWSSWIERGRDEPLPILLGATAWALAWFAVWLLTRPEPGGKRGAGRASAWALRVLTTAPYLTAFATPVVLKLLGPWGALPLGICAFCVAPATFLYYDRLCDAAHRLPNGRLSWQAAVISWLLPVAMLASMSSMVVFDRWPRGASHVLTILPMVGLGGVNDAWFLSQVVRARADLLDPLPLSVAPATILTAWAVAVLIQFRLEFAQAARAARRPASTDSDLTRDTKAATL